MSWLLQLYKTYESNKHETGIVHHNRFNREYTLLPVSHTTQNAHIEVNVTPSGDFHSATVIEKEDATTVIPTTEDSSSRSGKKIAPYPLHDKLAYCAGDFAAFSSQQKSEESYKAYMSQLADWALSEQGLPKVKSIYDYLRKGTLIKDLVKENVLYLGPDNHLIDKWSKVHQERYGDKPDLFKVVAGDQESAFIRFNVYTPESIMTKVWKDKSIYDSYSAFYERQLGEEGICYVTGRNLPTTSRHANKIRNPADKAKLISTNDSAGFTFRGRFNEASEAATISYEGSQKAHNALKWLIHKQGKTIESRVFLAWENSLEHLPDPMDDTFDLFGDDGMDETSGTNEVYARHINQAIEGYRADLSSKAEMNILVIDSATTGRLAVLYYRHMNKEHYLDRIQAWHESCTWLHRYRKSRDGRVMEFHGAPSPKDIAFAAYGNRANEKLVKGLMERMLPCIVDGKPIPTDIVKSASNRASNPSGVERWEWEKTLSIACALINKKEGLGVALRTDLLDRSYLFGRLLAVADVLERRALGRDESRPTNAIRYMNAFSKYPARTWKTIQESLQPYEATLGKGALDLTKLKDEIGSLLAIEDFNNKALTGNYLLGFYSQRHELYKKKESAVQPVSVGGNNK
ncbi:type I-C CRISPR-associated protein Cas8c/Csd1 [Rossellomorea marisflavi]|uniref:type I-C CRISPR-associated protein Cas8c/Csd1 n=1 Tax=Rossellomorea marisflavi TaxID=189381 RepID=UPI003D2EE47E